MKINFLITPLLKKKKGVKYYQIQDWKLLRDKKTVERNWGWLVKKRLK